MTRNPSIAISVIILTLNEELNLRHAIESVGCWSDDINIVDSGSSDRTVEIAEQLGATVYNHGWENWAEQRNWSLENCDIKYEWVLFLDADEQLTDISKQEIIEKTNNASDECLGFYLQFDFYFLGRRIRKAMHPHLRLIRSEKVRWENAGAREFCNAPSDCPAITAKLIHHDHRPISFWMQKQLRNAKLEAELKYQKRNGVTSANKAIVEGKLRHRLRDVAELKLPLFAFPFLSYFYRIIFKTNVFDGWAGFVYNFLFGFWYPIIIDAMCLEICSNSKRNDGGVS